MIMFMSISSITLLTQKKDYRRFYFLFGSIGNILWLYPSAVNGLWGMFIASLIFQWRVSIGLKNEWKNYVADFKVIIKTIRGKNE